MVVDNLFSVIHATVADLDGIAVEDFSEFVLLGKCLSTRVRKLYGPLANGSIPLKHVLGWGGWRKSGGDLTLNSLLRTWISLKHPPSFRAFKQLECMAKPRVSLYIYIKPITSIF